MAEGSERWLSFVRATTLKKVQTKRYIYINGNLNLVSNY